MPNILEKKCLSDITQWGYYKKHYLQTFLEDLRSAFQQKINKKEYLRGINKEGT